VLAVLLLTSKGAAAMTGGGLHHAGCHAVGSMPSVPVASRRSSSASTGSCPRPVPSRT
jgi:hypothetical protein